MLTTKPADIGINGVTVNVGVIVGVNVGVIDCVTVIVGVNVGVADLVTVTVGVTVGVNVGVID